jgi:hypothetical protein
MVGLHAATRSKAMNTMPSQVVAPLPRSGSSNRPTVKGVGARQSSFFLPMPFVAGYRVVYAVDAKLIAAG